jgi:hypothetical protein
LIVVRNVTDFAGIQIKELCGGGADGTFGRAVECVLRHVKTFVGLIGCILIPVGKLERGEPIDRLLVIA